MCPAWPKYDWVIRQYPSAYIHAIDCLRVSDTQSFLGQQLSSNITVHRRQGSMMNPINMYFLRKVPVRWPWLWVAVGQPGFQKFLHAIPRQSPSFLTPSPQCSHPCTRKLLSKAIQSLRVIGNRIIVIIADNDTTQPLTVFGYCAVSYSFQLPSSAIVWQWFPSVASVNPLARARLHMERSHNKKTMVVRAPAPCSPEGHSLECMYTLKWIWLEDSAMCVLI